MNKKLIKKLKNYLKEEEKNAQEMGISISDVYDTHTIYGYANSLIAEAIEELVKSDSKTIKLYYHKTDGGAEYLFDTFKKFRYRGKTYKEGVINDKTKYVVRIDGDITKDAELTIR